MGEEMRYHPVEEEIIKSYSTVRFLRWGHFLRTPIRKEGTAADAEPSLRGAATFHTHTHARQKRRGEVEGSRTQDCSVTDEMPGHPRSTHTHTQNGARWRGKAGTAVVTRGGEHRQLDIFNMEHSE